MELLEKKCIPCSGGVPPMPQNEAIKLLEQIHGDWELSSDATTIYRKFKFKNFKKPMELAQKFGEIAEIENHHPEISLSWGWLIVKITTHKIKGLTESDFVLAAKYDNTHKNNL